MSSICLSKRWLAQVTANIRFACTRFNPAWASGFRDGPLFWAQKALRRASGVWSLGGAGLIPE